MTLRAWPGPQPPLGVNYSLNRASPQAVGLVGWWPAIGGNAGIRRDLASGFNGVYAAGSIPLGNAVAARPEMGPMTTFAAGGTDSYVVGTIPALDATAAGFSATAWVIVASTASTDGAVVGKLNTTAPFNGWMMWRSGATFVFYINAGARATSATIATGNLYHVTMTWDGTTPKIYINGQINATGSSYTTVPVSGFPFHIGRYHDAAGRAFDGQIGDVRYYNRALSAAEVWAQWNPATRWNLYGVQVARRGPVLSAVFRRTLSQHGTRIGSRQVAA